MEDLRSSNEADGGERMMPVWAATADLATAVSDYQMFRGREDVQPSPEPGASWVESIVVAHAASVSEIARAGGAVAVGNLMRAAPRPYDISAAAAFISESLPFRSAVAEQLRTFADKLDDPGQLHLKLVDSGLAPIVSAYEEWLASDPNSGIVTWLNKAASEVFLSQPPELIPD